MASVTKHIKCKNCGKVAIEVSRLKFGREFMVKLQCGHSMFTRELDRIEPTDKLQSFLTNHTPFEFQKYTLEFILKAGGRVGIFHEQGLGKTICAALALRTNRAKMLPAMVICKSNLAFQWMKQSVNWIDLDLPIQIIESSSDFILPNAQMYIISYDLLRRLSDEKYAAFDNVKTVIIDECQHIKNPTSQRANNVRRICRDKPYVMGISGTPIKNHSGEYFSILNLLKPERFPSQAYYEARYVDKYWDGYRYKVGGLRNELEFRRNTEDFIIRFEQKDVMPDLPDLIRDFQYLDIDKDLRKAYDRTEGELVDFIETNEGELNGFAQHQHILSYLNKMRQITALAKISAVVENIQDTLDNTGEKCIVFLHHHIARDVLIKQLDTVCKANDCDWAAITEKTSNDTKENIKRKFSNDPRLRVLVLGTLASGEGLDGLQDSCNVLIMMERQWNPANEEQAEKRLQRIGQRNIVQAKYPIAVGTVDEMFTELIEKKRQSVKQTMGDSEVIAWDETDTVRGLVAAIYEKRGGKKWAMA
jgi:SWI/SNF-related matrix-associated actin-dependent regulator 1 of chromatin subfamily A